MEQNEKPFWLDKTLYLLPESLRSMLQEYIDELRAQAAPPPPPPPPPPQRLLPDDGDGAAYEDDDDFFERGDPFDFTEPQGEPGFDY